MAPCTDDAIIVAGSGRSGTTWLGNIVAGDDRRILFEPFECRRVPEFRDLGLRPYFPPSDPLPHWHEIFKKVLCGQIASPWVDQDYGRLNPEKAAGGVVIKEIRANGILSWIGRNFPCTIIYLLRHPCAVIASRMKLGWETHLDAYLGQPRLVDDYLLPYLPVIQGAETTAQRHAVMWCLENLVPLSQAQPSWIFCTYEDLYADPEVETKRILNLLGLDFTDARRRAVNELSRTCSGRGAEEVINFLADWQGVLSPEDKGAIAEILGSFGITQYDVNQLMPLASSRGSHVHIYGE